MNFLLTFKQQLINDPSVRMASSFIFVVGVYASAVLLAVNWSSGHATNSARPMAAMMIELAPVPVAPETPANIPDPTPPPPEPIPEPEPEIEPLPEIETAEAVLPPEPIKEEPIEEQPIPEELAPPSFEAPPEEVAAAPMEGAVSLAPSKAKATWESVLLGHLERHKRYPREARRKRQQAVVTVRITINRDGTVLDYRLERPCRHKSLNQEALALIARAQPLPPPPPKVKGKAIEFVVPIEFFLKT